MNNQILCFISSVQCTYAIDIPLAIILATSQNYKISVSRGNCASEKEFKDQSESFNNNLQVAVISEEYKKIINLFNNHAMSEEVHKANQARGPTTGPIQSGSNL